MTNLAQDYGKLLFQLNYPTETVENFYNILNGSDELLTALDNPTVTKAFVCIIKKSRQNFFKSILVICCKASTTVIGFIHVEQR